MARRPGAEPTGLTKRRIAMVAIPTAVAALTVNLGIRAVAVGQFEVPAQALPLAALVMASVMPVFGPAIGCYVAFRHPSPNSMRKFLLPGAALALMGVLIEVVRFAVSHHHPGALVVGGFQGVIATGLALPLLLRLVARTAVAARPTAGGGE
jgi:hypothetical protein